MKLKITSEDLKRGTTVTPGWYSAEVKEVKEEAAGSGAKHPGSMNWNVQFKIIGGEFDGVPVYRTFNEAGAGFAKTYVESFLPGGKIPPTGIEIDMQKTVGKQLKIYVKNKLYEGVMRNEVAEFMAIDAVVQHKSAS